MSPSPVPVHREPVNICCCLLRTVVGISRPLTDMKELWARKRHKSFTWKSLLHAGDRELRSELMWAHARRAEPCSVRMKKLPDSLAKSTFINALLDTEQERRKLFLS